MSPAKQIDANSVAKQRAALASAATSLALTIAKLAAGLASGSLALLTEGLHNALDVAASAMTFFAVRAADAPADEEHPFGHAKIEAVAALAETGFLIALAVGVAVEAVRRLAAGGASIDAGVAAIGVVVVSIVVDFFRWRALSRIAERTQSEALEADALHYSSDLVASVFVLAGLIGARFGFAQGDGLAALGVVVFILIAGIRLGRRTIDSLIDAAPTHQSEELRALVEASPGVVAVDAVRLRRSGAQTIGEVLLRVARTTPLESVAEIKRDVVRRITQRWPRTQVTVTADPLALDDESIVERVLLIAARRRLGVHHLAVHVLGKRRSVTLDLEVDGRMSLGTAHESASGLEGAIRQELGDDVEVETHIEPLEAEEIAGVEAGADDVARIRSALVAAATDETVLEDVHNVRVRRTPRGLFVVFHVRADPGVAVAAAHVAADGLERSLRAACPDVAHVVVHVEPRRPGPALAMR